VHNNVEVSCGKDPGVGQQLKAFSLESTDGKTVSEADFRGRVTLVNFWGTWCKPCLEELPQFDRLYRRYRKHGLSFVAIATDEDPAPVAAFGKRRKIAAKLLVGGEEYANFYKSPKFPFSFVVDPSGKIVASFRGYEHKCMGKVEAELRKQLEQRAAKKR
jgi:thiol-disulfide isomerase/thioredoxin